MRRADGYYCQFCLDINSQDIQPLTGQEIGLDVGLESFYTDSNGLKEPNPKFLRTVEKAVKHAQRRIYKKVSGSKCASALVERTQQRVGMRDDTLTIYQVSDAQNGLRGNATLNDGSDIQFDCVVNIRSGEVESLEYE